LEPFSEGVKVAFLTKFWHHHSELQEGNQKHLETYATALINELAKSISDRGKGFTGIPLQTRLLAEAYKKEVKTYCLKQKSDPELNIHLRLVDLYAKFIIEKINIFKSKGKVAEEQLNDIIKFGISVNKNQQKLALEVLLPELKDTFLKLEGYEVLPPEVISGIGIVQYVDDKPYFIHRTFAEYSVAEFMATQLTKETRYLLGILNILFNLTIQKEYAVINFFLNELLIIPEESKLIKQYGKEICKIWKAKRIYKIFQNKKYNFSRKKLMTVLCRAAADGYDHIVDFVFCGLKATKNLGIIKQLLLHMNQDVITLTRRATKRGNIEKLQSLLFWGRMVNANLKDDPLLSHDFIEKTAWVLAAGRGNKEILNKLWCYGRELKVNLKDDLLLVKDIFEKTAWIRAAENIDKEILDKLWYYGREAKVNLKDDLLLATDCYGETAWLKAAVSGDKSF
jgi:hypothetical protein